MRTIQNNQLAIGKIPRRYLKARRLSWSIAACAFAWLSAIGASPQSGTDSLRSGFENPPASARPRVWWHWMNGNITEEGIRLDLEWMHRAGVAGFQNFDAALATPQVVDKRLAYMTPEWQHAFKYAVTLGHQLGMEEAIASSPGWSETGGPWVPAAQAMKKYVWSSTLISGGTPFKGQLVSPPSVSGPFQDIAGHDSFSSTEGSIPRPQFYRDAVLIAYRVPASEVASAPLRPKVTSSGGKPDETVLFDGDLLKSTQLPVPNTIGESSWIQYEYPTPQAMRSLTCVMKELDAIGSLVAGITNPKKSLQVSDDGQHFRDVAQIPEGGTPEHTVSFPTVSARFFRVVFTRPPPPPVPAWLSGMDPSAMGFQMPAAPTNYEISELALSPAARVNRFEDKAGFAPVSDLYQFATPAFEHSTVVDKSDVIDLTKKMEPDGTLEWNPPPGQWRVLRIGYSLLGITNHPATKEATGLEVDKLNAGYVKNYMNGYLQSYEKAVGPELMGRKGIGFVVTDSWEAGSQNWTDDMLAQFRKRRGYDPTPWLPVLTGVVMVSSAASDRFLWDFRKTIADLIAEQHYGQVQASLKEHGLGHYGESHEYGRALIGDGMELKKLDDIPMSAMWVQLPGVYEENYNYNADDRESASVAHIYGQNVAAAESLTAAAAPWAWSPATLKPVADQEFLNGINRFVIHESAHQPLVDKVPGLTLGPFGQWFNRNETWAEQARPWTDYLARTSFLLQQGHFAADILHFYGEDTNLTALFQNSAPEVPAGHGFDYINADGLIHQVRVNKGRIVTASGMEYRLLSLDPYSRHMSLPVLRAIRALVEQGAIVAGSKPVDDPSLADDPQAFKQLAEALFGDGTGVHRIGQGAVYAGQNAAQALDALGVEKDFDYTSPQGNPRLLFVHRRLSGGDLYFVANRSSNESSVQASFRVAGKEPELWRAETGRSESASYEISHGRTLVPLHLEPWGTVFVVFRHSTTQTVRVLPSPRETKVAELTAPWTVAFQPGRGAPVSIAIDTLKSWTESSEAGVKYFSGVGTYTQSFDAPGGWFREGKNLVLDLGDVKNLAEVMVNGKSLGIVWHAPYRVDATQALKPGRNEVTVKVTNSWVNRLIGDEQPDTTTKYTFADVKPYNAKSPLLPSGLLGPVQIFSADAAPN